MALWYVLIRQYAMYFYALGVFLNPPVIISYKEEGIFVYYPIQFSVSAVGNPHSLWFV